MTVDRLDPVEFDELIAVALAQAAGAVNRPGTEVRERLMSRLAGTAAPIPPGAASDPVTFITPTLRDAQAERPDWEAVGQLLRESYRDLHGAPPTTDPADVSDTQPGFRISI